MRQIWLPALLMLTAFVAAFLSVAAIQSGSIIGFVLLSVSALAHVMAYVMLLLGYSKFSIASKTGAAFGLIYVMPALFLNIKAFYSNENISFFSLAILVFGTIIFLAGILYKKQHSSLNNKKC